MLGTQTFENVCQTDLTMATAVVGKLKDFSTGELKFLKIKNVGEEITELESTRAVLERCVELEKQFNVVKRDLGVLRPCTSSKGNIFMIPLVFGVKLPATVYAVHEQDNAKFRARVPRPTPEASDALREHGGKFDHMELWWVPRDILVEEIPDHDPILVGAIDIPRIGTRFFELHRWIDETVEDGWWKSEGY